MDSQWFLGRLDVALGLIVNQYKPVCAISLSLELFNFSLYLWTGINNRLFLWNNQLFFWCCAKLLCVFGKLKICETLICENCENLEKKVHYLVKTVDKLFKGQSNFENVLASQNCVFGKAGLGFNPQNKQDRFSKSFSKLPEKQLIDLSKQPVVTCFYCMKRGHSVRFCKIRKYVVPRGFMKWIPKCSKGSNDVYKPNGPTFIRGPNLCTWKSSS